jgi:hypothetical protein
MLCFRLRLACCMPCTTKAETSILEFSWRGTNGPRGAKLDDAARAVRDARVIISWFSYPKTLHRLVIRAIGI